MAHFAELDENNVVIRVIVVGNQDLLDENGIEQEHIGIQFCQSLFGGRWVQTSYNATFRKRYAGAGMLYNEQLDAFMHPKPFPSWLIDEENASWKPPIPKPNIQEPQRWDEENQQWIIAYPENSNLDPSLIPPK